MKPDAPAFWFQYNPAKLDELCSNLDAAQDGAFRRIFDRILRLDGRLLDRDVALASITKTGRMWKAIKAALVEQGLIEVTDGFIRIELATEVLVKTRKYRAQKATAGRASHAPGKRLKTNETTAAAVDDPQDVRSQSAGCKITANNTVSLRDTAAATATAAQELPPVHQHAEATTQAAPASEAAVVVFKDEAERVRSQLWTEGKAILNRLASAMSKEAVGNVVGLLAKAHGGGTRGGTRAIQALRDVEQAVAASGVPGYAAADTPEAKAKVLHQYLMGVVAKAKASPSSPNGAPPVGEPKSGSAEWLKQQRERKAAELRARQGGGVPPSGGPIIDGKAEAV